MSWFSFLASHTYTSFVCLFESVVSDFDPIHGLSKSAVVSLWSSLPLCFGEEKKT